MSRVFRVSFQDSEVGQVSGQGDELRVRFSAAAVDVRLADDGASSSPGRLLEAGPGHLRSLEMRCSGARWTGDLSDCIGRLVQGVLHIGPQARHTTVVLPFEASGGVSIELGFQNGSTLSVTADTVAFVADEDASFTPSLAC